MEFFCVLLILCPISYALSCLFLKTMRLMSDYEERNQKEKRDERNTIHAYNKVFKSHVEIADEEYIGNRNVYSNDFRAERVSEKRTFPTPEEFEANPELEFMWDTWANATWQDRYNAEHDPRYSMLSINEFSLLKYAEREREEEERQKAEAEEAWRRRLDDEWYEEQRRKEED